MLCPRGWEAHLIQSKRTVGLSGLASSANPAPAERALSATASAIVSIRSVMGMALLPAAFRLLTYCQCICKSS